MKTICILQSSYIPWKGYFDIIGISDDVMVFDEAQFTKNDWRNRNRIKTARGTLWLTIPVRTSGRLGQPIDTVEIADRDWAARHWETLRQAYLHTPHFPAYETRVRGLYEKAAGLPLLSAVNLLFLRWTCATLGIRTRFVNSRAYGDHGRGAERVLGLCAAAGAGRYLSGPAGAAYLDAGAFTAAGIELAYMDYGGYPPYPQPHGTFDHAVSILDLLFCTGPEAPRHMKWPHGAPRPQP
ncbi:MAG: WbqC family protein [Rhodospirillales bacterium]